MNPRTSKLVQDLNSVPAIIGALGINIAEAQKLLNKDYLDNVERLIVLIKSTMKPIAVDGGAAELDGTPAAPTPGNADIVRDLLRQLAPSRYQFTETTLQVRLDLAQTIKAGLEAGFSVGVGAVAVNAALTVGFGYQYQAAAEVRTILHAIPSSESLMTPLLARAEKLGTLTLPPVAAIDQAYIDKAHDIVSKLIGKEIKKPEPEPAPNP